MRHALLCLLIVVAAGCAATVRAAPEAEAAPAAEEPPKEVDELEHMQLTAETFDEEIKKHDLSAVFFYAPWCGHCKRAKPEWIKAEEILKADGIPLFAVNADEAENRPLGSKYGVRGFPTILLFRRSVGFDKPTPYEAGRDSASFVSNIKSYSGPAATYLDQADKSILTADDHAKVSVFAFVDKKDSAQAQAFEDAVDSMRTDGYFYVTENTAIASVIHEDLAVKPNTMVLFRHFDGAVKSSEAITTKDAVTTFINSNYVAPFLSFSDLSGPIAGRAYNGPHAYNIFVYGDLAKKDAVAAWAKPLPGKFAGVLAPAVIWDTKGPESRIGSYFGLRDDIPVSLAMVNLREDKKKFVLMEDELTEAKAAAFIEDVQAGKIEPYLKSEPVPEKNDEAVTVVVGKTFDEIVLGGKNVLLEIYAPWCGHCKALEPTYKEVGEAMQADEEVVIAKLDGTLNDLIDQRFPVQGFPALFFISAEGEVKSHEGGRTFDDIVKFVNENKKPVSADVLNESKKTDPVQEL